MSRRTLQLAALFLVGTLLCITQNADAQTSEGDWGLTLSVGPMIRTGPKIPAVGPAVGFRASYGVHPLWNLTLESLVSLPVPTKKEQPHYLQGGFFAGLSSQLDMVAVVPWLGVAAGALIEPGARVHTRTVLPAIMATVGIDVRQHRTHSMGVQADLIATFDPKFDVKRYVRVAFRYTWMRGPNNF